MMSNLYSPLSDLGFLSSSSSPAPYWPSAPLVPLSSLAGASEADITISLRGSSAIVVHGNGEVEVVSLKEGEA